MRNNYDAIIGKRCVRGDGQQRKFVEDVLCRLLRHYFSVRLDDANAPFRLMCTSLLQRYIDRLPVNYNLPNVMLTAWFAYYHENVVFREITFRARQGGVNSINIRRIVEIGLHALADFRQFRKEMEVPAK